MAKLVMIIGAPILVPLAIMYYLFLGVSALLIKLTGWQRPNPWD